MKLILKITLIVFLIIVAALGGLMMYGRHMQQQTADSAIALLDYKTIDAQHMPRELMENFVRSCAGSALQHGAPKERAVTGCSCVANHIAASVPEKEFREYDTALVMKTSPNAQTASRMVAIVSECRTNTK